MNFKTILNFQADIFIGIPTLPFVKFMRTQKCNQTTLSLGQTTTKVLSTLGNIRRFLCYDKKKTKVACFSISDPWQESKNTFIGIKYVQNIYWLNNDFNSLIILKIVLFFQDMHIADRNKNSQIL